MAEPLATTPIRYSFGADEHLFAEVSESMSVSYTHLTLPTIYSV